jgi:hypothetical protein
MPHFFLMNESEMQKPEALQLRARLHIRSFWTLMQYGKFAHGITILYDAFECAVHRFILLNIPDMPRKFLEQTSQAYTCLKQNGLIKSDFELESFENLVASALQSDFDQTNPDFDSQRIWKGIEPVFRELGTVPFDPEKLPEENEATRKAMGLE